MQEWKIRQDIFHKVLSDQDLGDNFSEMTIIEERDLNTIVTKALEYPVKQISTFSYPAKSYAVAITFAKLLEKKFGENFYKALDDQNLLYGNDPFFKPYSSEKSTYDLIIKKFPWNLIDETDKASENFQKTVQYFYKEFLLHEETKMYAPS